jgi:hypothetical protein
MKSRRNCEVPFVRGNFRKEVHDAVALLGFLVRGTFIGKVRGRNDPGGALDDDVAIFTRDDPPLLLGLGSADGFAATVSAAATTQRGGMAVSRLEGRGITLGSVGRASRSGRRPDLPALPVPGPIPRIERSSPAVTGRLSRPGSDAPASRVSHPAIRKHHWRRL